MSKSVVELTETEASMVLSSTHASPTEAIGDEMKARDLMVSWMMGPQTSMHDDIAACILVRSERRRR